MQRNILLYYAFSFLVGLYIATGTTVLFERELGLSFSQIFTLDAIYMLMFILFEIPSGALADLIGRKKTILTGLAALVVAAIATGLSESFLHLFLSFFIWAFGFSLISGSSEALLYDTIGDEKRFHRITGRALSFSIAGLACAGVVGPLLYDQYFRLPYLVSTIPFALALIAMFFYNESTGPSRDFSLGKHFAQIKDSIRMAFTNRNILWGMGVLSLVFAVSYTFTSSYQPYLIEVGFDVTQFIYILPVMFIIEALGGTWSEKLTSKIDEEIAFWVNFLLLAASLIILGFFASTHVVPLLFVYGFVQGVLRPIISTYSNRYIASSHRATVISVQMMCSTIVASALLFSFGFLTDRIGVIALAGVTGLIALVGGITLLILKPADHRIN
jgi:MFS family permease